MATHDGGDVSDSTDWLGTPLACLMPVEAAFRCHVCKDFYNSPMITTCNHSFCSLCIRRCLSVEGKCPVCRATDQESKLRGNWALRDAVDSFVAARSAVLALAHTPPPPAQQPAKRKVDSASGPVSDGSQDEPRTKRTRASARLCKNKAVEAVASRAADEVADEVDDDSDLVEVHAPKNRGGADADADYKPDDGLIECPICATRVKMTLINSHLDSNCTTGAGASQPKPAPTFSKPAPTASSTAFKPMFAGSAPIKAPDRLPSISYSLLSDTALRKKMISLGLSSTGPRLLLERRHKEWLTIWNANCDSARPKRKHELLRDLDVWERTVGALVVGGGGAATLASRPIMAATQQAAMIKDKNFDASAWQEKHSTSFQDLIANARKSRTTAQQPATEASETNTAQDAAVAPPAPSVPLATADPLTDVAIPDSNPPSPLSEPDTGAVGAAVRSSTDYGAHRTSSQPADVMVVEL